MLGPPGSLATRLPGSCRLLLPMQSPRARRGEPQLRFPMAAPAPRAPAELHGVGASEDHED